MCIFAQCTLRACLYLGSGAWPYSRACLCLGAWRSRAVKRGGTLCGVSCECLANLGIRLCLGTSGRIRLVGSGNHSRTVRESLRMLCEPRNPARWFWESPANRARVVRIGPTNGKFRQNPACWFWEPPANWARIVRIGLVNGKARRRPRGFRRG